MNSAAAQLSDVTLSVSEFVAVCNQTLEYAYPHVTITGELANFKVSRGRWIYFDLKDAEASVRFFGTVYQLPGPLQDGMLVAVKGMPRLHPQYGFSITVEFMQPAGEGSIKKAAKLLEAKLAAEGLFDEARKRAIPPVPQHIGLIASAESAAYRDFIKVIGARWGGLYISLIDVQVQGEAAVAQVVQAIEQFNELAVPPEVVVITRGGGSAEDLQAFSTEQVTRAVAASRIPTVVAIGHEVDISLAELAADQRASTPSNAAELLVPDRKAVAANLRAQRQVLTHLTDRLFVDSRQGLAGYTETLQAQMGQLLARAKQQLAMRQQLVTAFNPQAALARGYAIVRDNGAVVRSGREVTIGDTVDIRLVDAHLVSVVKRITMIREE